MWARPVLKHDWSFRLKPSHKLLMPPDTNLFSYLKRAFDIDTLFLEVPHMDVKGNVYVINDKNAIIMIDTGSKTPKNIRTISRYIESRKKPVYLLLTHEHTDHIGLAKILQIRYGSTVFIHNKTKAWTSNFETKWDERSKLVHDLLLSSAFPVKYVNYFDDFHKVKIYAESFDSNHYVNDNDILNLAGRKIRVIYTPGHSVGSACFYDYEYRLLYCGDHIIGGYNSLPTIEYIGKHKVRYLSIANSIKSFEKLAKYKSLLFVLPGHGNIVTDLGKYESKYICFINKYKAIILGILFKHAKLTPFEIYKLLYMNGVVNSSTHFFGRIQLLFCILDILESEEKIRRYEFQNTLHYSFNNYSLNRGIKQNEPVGRITNT